MCVHVPHNKFDAVHRRIQIKERKERKIGEKMLLGSEMFHL